MESACAIFPSVACPAPHCLLNDMIFGEKVVEPKMCVVIFSTTFV